MAEEITMPDRLYFKDDGVMPNSKYPVLLYRNAFSKRGAAAVGWLEQRFAANGWTNAWRWGIYPFHHYHSNTHEVLGVFRGSAALQLGGEAGKEISVGEGDIIVIPAGVGHKCIRHSEDFTVVGAYPFGLEPDLHKGQPGARPATDKNIAAVKLPLSDPLYSNEAGLLAIWK